MTDSHLPAAYTLPAISVKSRFNSLMTHGLLISEDWNGFATNEKLLLVVLVPVFIRKGNY
jgi:hypothetical protein